jgi:hypothetical protein
MSSLVLSAKQTLLFNSILGDDSLGTLEIISSIIVLDDLF